jgi:hypothetical protein
VLGGEEDGQPAVGHLSGELQVLRPDGGEVDRHIGAVRVQGELEGLARPVRQRQREVLPLMRHCLARQRHADHLDVLARAGERLVEANPVPALGHLGA